MNLLNSSCVWWCNCVRLLKRARLSRLIALLLLVVVFFPLVVHYYLSNYASDGHLGVRLIGRTPLDHIEDPAYLQAADIVARIKELKRIHTSVNNELRQLESKRQRLHAEISSYGMHADKLKVENEISSKTLQKLKITIENVKVQQQEAQLSNAPLLFAPRQILADLTNDAPDLPSPVSTFRCRMSKCFDYSRCPLTSGFRVYFYEPASSVDPFVRSSVSEATQRSSYATRDPKQACVYVALLGEVNSSQVLQKYLRELPYWHGDGRNHILLNFAYKSTTLRNIFEGVDTARAVIVQSAFRYDDYRPDFDIIVPPLTGRTSGAVWSELPVMLPIRRKYFLSFQGAHKLLTSQQQTTNPQLLSQLLKVEADILQILKQMQARSADSSYEEYFYFYFYCNKVAEFLPADDTEWTLCADEKSRRNILEQSTFSLVLAPVKMSYVSTVTLQQRLLESIKYGAVPVILGDYVELPFSPFLEWKKAAIILPKARITELHFLLRTLSDTDIFRYRQQGREIYEKYLGTTASVFETILLTLRLKLHIPSAVIRDHPSPSAFNASFTPLKKTIIHPDTEMEDILGPVEVPRPSPKFTRNFTFGYSLLNDYGDTFHSFPFTPFEPVLPSDAKFHGSWLGFRPIAQGQGGSGKEFTESLGGNYPTEQFTVVILTYEREAVLVNALERFKDLPYLNKVIVVWNSPRHPSEDLQWPEIGVRIVVIRSPKNSLNSRFLPYDEIETEAILSIDDDTHLRHDEIMFGFRVWREARDRLVGFPGRFHSWEPNMHSWYYNSNYTCELSMVLTGAAFYHKYYAYLYSYIMPSAIRDMVDEYMNCEDLAMNFLVSHITRKPPIKVTSRWTFRCPGCPKALSFDEEHFQERHTCLNFFVKVYGYMPLLYTQFRVDSVLFKTRIPHDKQKCFKFI